MLAFGMMVISAALIAIAWRLHQIDVRIWRLEKNETEEPGGTP